MSPSTQPTNRPFTVFIDGECPLCAREASMLEKLDRGRGRLNLVDLTSADFDPTPYGLTRDQLMASIHGITPDGEIVKGMEVFRRAYAEVKLGWLLAPTRWPVLRWIFDRFYAFFARHRLRLTGRGSECAGGACATNLSGTSAPSP